MASFWDYFSVLAPSVGLGLIFWLVMRSVFRVDTGERHAKAELEEREAEEWARSRAQRTADGASAPDGAELPEGDAPGEGPNRRP
jgi:hypothetical protein